MRIEHRLPSDLVRRGPVRVLIVGAGGTGSTIAMNLPYLDQAMRVWGHASGLDVTMMDADTVSATNCVRQPFSASDIGQNKATVLINRINIFWGTKWAAIPNRFHARSFDRHRDPVPDVVISCVDTREARKVLVESFTRALSNTCYWLDLGNNAASGQYVLGQPLNGRNRRKAERLRTVSELFPEIVDAESGEDPLPSCSAVEALDRQEPFINQTLAMNALAMLSQIPSLFRTNAFLVISDGLEARIGSLMADPERFMPWRTIDGNELVAKGTPELQTLLFGVFEKRRFLDLIHHFIVFGESPTGLNKILAGYHQYHAVRHAVESTLKATSQDGDRRVGVVWHTQGSGKSLLMAFYAGQVIKHPLMENPTLVIITDRNDLDDQLFATFGMCRDLIRQTPQQAEDRDHLRTLLDRPAGGVIFTTIQKFTPDDNETRYPLLTNRRNVIVIADEAHRSQYGFKAKIAVDTGAITYGFAKYLRDAVPNASFIGFTGTPIEKDDVNTPVVFGNYIDIYDISRAVSDGATVPIYYESRLARIELVEEEKPKIDLQIAEILEGEDSEEQERINKKLAAVEALVGSDKRLELVASDLIQHFEDRVAALEGKAMIVCMSRRICVALYKEITRLRPDWHRDEDDAGTIKVVMTGSSADPEDWQQHIGRRQKSRRELLAKRAKRPDDPLKLVIVRDMWLTGFDAPCMHTMYVDKPMQGHGLMQAIARVNRVFRDKPAGLVVDYIGVAQNLKEALKQYSSADREEVGIDEAKAVAVLLEKYGIVRDMFWPETGGFDYRPALVEQATSHERLVIMAGAIDWILTNQQREAEREESEEAKQLVHRRYADAVLALSKAFALAAATDAARKIRDEVGFFQALRSAMVKTSFSAGHNAAEREFAIRQIISRAVVSTEIIDIMKAAGINTPDISILSDDFLREVRELDKKNLALEALRKLINGEVRSQSSRNIVQARAFSERLEDAIARYHNNAITTVQVLEDLIQLAKDIRVARTRGEENALSQDEVAFYDALANNKSARDLMSEPTLRVIAHELLVSVRGNITVDWMHRDAARARIRVTVKRILRKYGYPPDLQDAAVQTVLQQAEALSAEWAEAL